VDLIVNLFDFIGSAKISASDVGETAQCDPSIGSHFTYHFLKDFDDSYHETLLRVEQNIDSTPIYELHLKYAKYRKAVETKFKVTVDEPRRKRTKKENE